MKRNAVVLVLLTLSISSNTNAGLEEYCRDKWPGNTRMAEYCIEQQIEGQRKVFSIARKHNLVKDGRLSVSPHGSDYEKMIYMCMDKWEIKQFGTYNSRMVAYCLEQQIESYVSTNSESAPATSIEKFCSKKWPDNFRMKKHCIDQQEEAKQEFFRISESNGWIKNSRINASLDGTADEKYFLNCLLKWTNKESHTTDYRMVVYCIKKGR